MRYRLLLLVLFLATASSFAQIKLDGDFRTRTEYRHGFQTLVKQNQDAAFFTSQRSRINLGYKDEQYTVKFSVQDVRTWGSQPQTVQADGLLSLHEAWVEYSFNKQFAAKVGRMELAYDNHRILGNLDWAQQGRKHDLALLKFNDSTFTLHAGFAFNQDKEQSATTLYTVQNSYKAMQFLWANKQFYNLNLSFLFLNNGTEFSQTDETGAVIDHQTKFMQTTGFNAEIKKGDFFVNAFGYAQTGRDNRNRRVQAWDGNLEAGYKATKKLTLSLGTEYLSGTSNGSATGSNQSFTPLYGTNHIFNGYMDYFFVGNHINNVGLQDAYAKVRYNVWKGFLSVDLHHFQSAATLIDAETQTSVDKYLGTELDITIRQNISKELSIQAGYSHMFASTSMETLKGGSKDGNNWAYLWLIFKPDFLKKKSQAE